MYLSLALLSISLVFLVFRLFSINVYTPLNYSGDALVHYNFVQNIEDFGWWTTNERLGLPLTQQLYDFPLSENLYLFIIKLLVLLGFDWIQSTNLFFVLTFPLTTLVFFWVSKKLNISYLIGFPLAIVYSFLPYHFYRGVNHLFLSAYFMVPLAVYLSLKIASRDLVNMRVLLFIAVLLGAVGAYYTFFSLIFIILGFVIGILGMAETNKKYVFKSLLLISLVILSFVLNLTPSIFYNMKYGQNLNSVIRAPKDTETFGLRISQLVLPIEEHNLELFKKIRIKFNTYGLPETVNETQFSSLGLISSVGFVILVLFGLFFEESRKFFKLSNEIFEQIRVLSIFNFVALVFSTIGGLGLLFSVYFSPIFRSINRLSIFIACFSLICLGLILEKYLTKRKVALFVLLLIPLSLYDQISPAVMQNFSGAKNEVAGYQTFVNDIENSIGSNASIFTLPFSQYPEGSDKNLMKLALLSENLKFSTGSSKWRSSNYWQHSIVQLPIEEMVTEIIEAGFSGLLIYTPDYLPKDLNIIRTQIKEVPLVDSSGKYHFYNLKGYMEEKNINVSNTEVFYSISGKCINNFNGESKVKLKHWCLDNAYIVFENISENSISKILSLQITLPDMAPKEYSKVLLLEPGITKVDIYALTGQINGIFAKPFDEIFWPSDLGYPNIIINEVKIEDLK